MSRMKVTKPYMGLSSTMDMTQAGAPFAASCVGTQKMGVRYVQAVRMTLHR